MYRVVYVYNGDDYASEAARVYHMCKHKHTVTPCVTERVTGQTIQSLWRISSSTSGANTSSNGRLLESKNKQQIDTSIHIPTTQIAQYLVTEV